MQLPLFFCIVVDCSDLLQVLDGDARSSFVFHKNVFPRFRVFLVIPALGETHTVVLGVVFDAVLLPRYRASGVFFVDATALVIVVIFLAVTGRIVPIIVRPVPRIEGFSEFLQNALTGLRVQSVVLVMGLQFVFEVSVIGDFARFIPHVAGVVVGDVPEFTGTPPVSVE